MSQFPIGQNFQAQGQLLTAAKEFTLVNWTGAMLPSPVATLEEVQAIRDTALKVSEKLGLESAQIAVAELQIRQRDVLTVAAPWGPYYE